MLLFVFTLPILNRWYTNVIIISNDLVQTSIHFGSRSYLFWVKVIGTTILAWSAQFLVVKAIFWLLYH